jgi:hypothetical protein
VPTYIDNTNQCWAKMKILLRETSMKKVCAKVKLFIASERKLKIVTSLCPVMVFVSKNSKMHENLKPMVSDIADVVIANAGVCITKNLSM